MFSNKIGGHSHSIDFERYTGIQLSDSSQKLV